ncbi:MAG: hypothetical protein KatS3mg129_2498 [Leptospiraceae bacterium]|nr:MAG: hypothetical protein KatS3mg129_2498 [Leptospiraceae bacterium]
MNLLITCEHGGNQIPAKFKKVIFIDNNILNSHYGYDLGALDLANFLYKNLKHNYSCYFLKNQITRLLIDFNRSLNHPCLFSRYSKNLPESYKLDLLNKYHLFRNSAKAYIESKIKYKEQILHLSIHSFTPIFKKKVRKTEIGILFDPSREEEYHFAKIMKKKLIYKCHFNLPYRGISDGHTQSLRQLFPKYYIGIEIEVNQKFLNDKSYFPDTLKQHLLEAIMEYLWIQNKI